MVRSIIIFACLFAFVGTLLVGCAGLKSTSGVDVPTQVALHILSPEEKTPAWAVAEVIKLQRGRALYRAACRTCHGEAGNAKGPMARFVDPLPRDFTRGVFKFRSTKSGALPTDGDLERSIRIGVPGTEMVAFGPVFNYADRMALVAYIKTFSSRFTDPTFALTAEDLADIPQKRPTPMTFQSVMLGAKLYVKKDCVKCHGPSGHGDGPSAGTLKDDQGRPIEAYDFTGGAYKSGSRDIDLYRSFTTGLAGTPMPSYADTITDMERWALVDHIKALKPSRGFFHRLLKERPE